MILEGEILGLIGSLGFPIAMCIFLLKERSNETKELKRAIQELTTLIKVKLKT